MKEVTLTVPWGQYDPIVKNQNKNTVYYNVFLFPNNISQHRFVLKYRHRDRHDCVLGSDEYIEADKKKNRKGITMRKQKKKKKKCF
jgi:hypothetical protein